MKNFKALFLKYRHKLIIGLSLLLIATAIVNIYYALEVNVTSNDECYWVPKKLSKDSTAIFFDIVKVNGVTWNAGIRNGDQLIEIDGVKLKSTPQAQMILNKFSSGKYAQYKVMRDGKIFTTKVYIKKLIQFGSLAGSLSALFWMLIGFIVLTAKPGGRIQRLFYFLGALAVLTSLNIQLEAGGFHKFYTDLGVIAILIGCLWLISVCFVAFMVNYFFINFPTPFKIAEKKWFKRIFFIVPAILSVIVIFIGVLSFNGIIDDSVFASMIQVLTIFNLVANFIAWIILIFQYRRIKTKEKKKPVLIMLVAMTFGIAITVYTAQIAPAIADSFFNSPEYYAPIILVALVPLFFAYAIFKYQLMDVSVVVRNTIIYGAATLTIAAIYFFVVYVAGQSISSALGAENQGIVAGVFFIIFAIVFQSSKDRFQDFLTRKFYPEQFAHQRMIIQFSNDISTVVGLDNILELMLKTFVEGLNIKKFGILLRDSKTQDLRLLRNVGMSAEECTIQNSNLVQFIKEKNLIGGLPVVEQNDFEKVFPENAKRLVAEEIFTIVPMLVKSKIIGLLLFGLKHSGSHFAGKDLELLYAAANQAAVSIENARLYNSEVQKQKIERDLDLARKIQQGLLPQCIPHIGNLDICGEMIPAMQVGGDYYDLIPFSDDKLFVVVGDVSGKGLSASLYMTKLQTMIQLSCAPEKTPKEILVDINKRMYNELDRNWFVTITLALFDLKKNSVKFCRAGHLPILLATNGTVQSYKSQGIGVGLEKGIIFEESLAEEEVFLKPGQLFVFFTDGITEAMNEKNELFSEEKLTELLLHKSKSRSIDIVSEIWSSVNTFRGSAEVNDDMTMVVVKVS
jgi:phosphoserine phosphatase RsbU/P